MHFRFNAKSRDLRTSKIPAKAKTVRSLIRASLCHFFLPPGLSDPVLGNVVMFIFENIQLWNKEWEGAGNGLLLWILQGFRSP